MKARQHTVPRFYLRRFAIPSPSKGEGDGFWVYRRGEGAPQWLPWQTVSIHSHFYSWVDPSGQRNTDMEDELGKVETVAAPIIEKLTTSGFSGLDAQDRNRLVFFVALVYARTPQRRQVVVDVAQRQAASRIRDLAADESRLTERVATFNRATGKTLSIEEARELLTGFVSGDETPRLNDKGQVAFPLSMVVPLFELFGSMNWSLIRAPNGAEFVTSDEPLNLSGPTGDPNPFQSGQVEITLPLDRQHCLLITSGGHADTVWTCRRRYVADIVRRQVQTADREVYAAHKSAIVARNFH